MTGFRMTQIYLTESNQEDKTFLRDSIPESVSIYERIEDFLENEDFDILAFDCSRKEMSEEEIRRILQLKFKGKFICDFSSFYEDLTGKVPLNLIDSRRFLSDAEFQGKVSKVYIRIKRLLDILFSIFLLLVSFPLNLLIAVAVKLGSRGKVLFRQERLGIRKHPFICYKFRTMKMEAEKETGPKWSSEDDPRITRVGKILRKTHLDELPQLWNILKGDMSFVGNRPIRKYFSDHLVKMIPYYDLRFLVKPGLTGWAQVNYGYSGSQEGQFEKFQFELFYIKKMSLFIDLFIIFKTIKTMFQRRGE